MAALTTNYSNDDDGLKFGGGSFSGTGVTAFEQWWKDAIDSLIEKHMNQGYKGATKTITRVGTGNSLIKLPSVAASITSITEAGTPINDYELDYRGHLLERTGNWTGSGTWFNRVKYVVTYTEPTIDQTPDDWRLVAAQCLGLVLMFIRKYKEFQIALTASDAGTAGSVSSAESNSFPANLLEEMRRTIQAGLKRGSV